MRNRRCSVVSSPIYDYIGGIDMIDVVNTDHYEAGFWGNRVVIYNKNLIALLMLVFNLEHDYEDTYVPRGASEN